MSSAPPSSAPPPDPGAVSFRRLAPGDRLPVMAQNCAGKATYAFDVIAGRYLLFGFFLSSHHRDFRSQFEALMARPDLFDDIHCAFFGVSIDPRDRGEFQDRIPGCRFAWDFDLSMSAACGATPLGVSRLSRVLAERRWVLVDPSLHVLQIFPMDETPVEAVIEAIARLPPPDRFGGVTRPPPILMLPNVFDPDLCRQLIEAYERTGGDESGVDRNAEGVLDFRFKRRKDVLIEDEALKARANWSIARRVLPEIERIWFMKANRIERHIVGCYSAEDGGHFAPHRDNGAGLSAHRRFAVSINLNDDFDGGEVVFPESGMEGHKAPPGWAIVFPCAVLHAVRHVSRGRRYAFLPFLYDDEGEAIRQRFWGEAGRL